jgi:hypothetical protein
MEGRVKSAMSGSDREFCYYPRTENIKVFDQITVRECTVGMFQDG